jgi:hypothetical protein
MKAFGPSLEEINDGNNGSGLFARVDKEESEGALELMSQFQIRIRTIIIIA